MPTKAPVGPKLPWKVIRNVPDAAAGRLRTLRWTTFSLPHNVFCDTPFGGDDATFVDLDTGLPKTVFNLSADIDLAAKSVKIRDRVEGGLSGSTQSIPGLLLGDGRWAMAWSCPFDGKGVRDFVAVEGSPRKIEPIQGELPGIALQTVTDATGGFLSIRSELHWRRAVKQSDPKSHYRQLYYRIAVYEIRDGVAKKLSADPNVNPYWRWVDGEIPQIGDWPTSKAEAGRAPDGAPNMFLASGQAIAIAPDGRYQEWDLTRKTWELLKKPDENTLVFNVFNSGTSLFLATADAEPLLWRRAPDGIWSNLGHYSVLARDGGRHLIVSGGGVAQVVEAE